MENTHLIKLSLLPINKTVVFYTPIEGKDVLVGTGTIPDGSSFLHAVLHAHSKEYMGMNDNGRKKVANKLRGTLVSKMDRERWENLSDGVVAKIPFQENITSLLYDVYRYIEDGKPGKTKISRKIIRGLLKDNETNFKLIFDMMPLSEFEKNLLPQSYDQSADRNIKFCSEKILKNTKEYYSSLFRKFSNVGREKVKYCVDKLMGLMKEVLLRAEEKAYSDYVDTLTSSDVMVDEYMVRLLSNRINRNIYLIDSKNRLPYELGKEEKEEKEKSIVILWLGGTQYEAVGRLLAGNRVQREFELDDSLVVRIRTFLYHPERVPQEYPNLIPYLPKGKDSTSKDGTPRQSSESSRSDYEASSHNSEEEKTRSSEEEKEESSDQSDNYYGDDPTSRDHSE